MSTTPGIKIDETVTLVNQSAFAGVGSERFYIRTGARIVVSVVVTSISGNLNVTFDNSGDNENWLQVLDFGTVNSTGIYQRIYSDFHPNFRINYNTTANADFKIIVSVHDNSSSTFIENANLLVDVDHTKGDSVQVGDGQDVLEVEPDGSINVNTTFPDIKNPIHQTYTNSIDTGVDGYGFKSVATYTSTDNLTKIKAMHVHSQGSAQARLLIDGAEIRRKDVSPQTSVAEFEFKVPRTLTTGQVFELQVRLAEELSGSFDIQVELEAFLAS